MSTNPDSSLPLRVATLLPADWAILEGLGIAPLRGEEFRLADGATVRRTTGGALFRSEDGVGVANVMFGEAGDTTLLGVLTLEALGYALDPRRRELRPLPMSPGVETLAR
jgi:hypothetical protein